MFSHSLPIIKSHDKGDARRNKTLLVNTRQLTDSASLKYHQNNGRNAGGHNWYKNYLGGL